MVLKNVLKPHYSSRYQSVMMLDREYSELLTTELVLNARWDAFSEG